MLSLAAVAIIGKGTKKVFDGRYHDTSLCAYRQPRRCCCLTTAFVHIDKLNTQKDSMITKVTKLTLISADTRLDGHA